MHRAGDLAMICARGPRKEATRGVVGSSGLGKYPPSPEPGLGHSVAVGHPRQGHRIEDLARQLHLDSLSVEGSTSHSSTDDRLVPVHGILHQASRAVA